MTADTFLDKFWVAIEEGLAHFALGMDQMISPLEVLGPGWVIFILALGTVALSRVLSRVYQARRLDGLKKKFHYLQALKAGTAKDLEKPEKIDPGKANRIFFDYYFESIMKKLVTTLMPVMLILGYVARSYGPEALMERFGQDWVFSLGPEIQVGALAWYIICIGLAYLVWGVAGKGLKPRAEA